MATEPKGNWKGNGVAPMSDYGARAAMALNQCLPGAHRDKLVARMFNVSLRMAKYLRTGQFWTIDRLSQASAVLGAAFDAALHPSSDAVHEFEMQDIAERLARLEARWDEVAAGSANQRLPSDPSEAARHTIRGDAAAPSGQPAQSKGYPLGSSLPPVAVQATVNRRRK